MNVICDNKLVLFRSSRCTLTLLKYKKILRKFIPTTLQSIQGEVEGLTVFTFSSACNIIQFTQLGDPNSQLIFYPLILNINVFITSSAH
jgi:hypothetical protein